MMSKEMVMKQWDEMSTLEQYQCIYSDMHKSAYGFRSHTDVSFWSEKDFEEEFKYLNKIIKQNQVETEQENLQAVENFKTAVSKIISHGAKDEDAALVWMTEGEHFSHSQDVEHWVWKQGILFTDYGQHVLDRLSQLALRVEQ